MTTGTGATYASAVLRALPSGWTVVHDGSTPGSADADHVVVGPGGIFLVAVRDRPGPAYALRREDDTVACSTAADVVAEMAGPYARRVRPVLCIVGDAELLEQALDVLVCSTATLGAALTSAPAVLTDSQADEAVALLGGAPAEHTAPVEPVAPFVETTPVAAVVPAVVPADPPRGKRARAVEPDTEPTLAESFAAVPTEAARGKRARAVEPEEPPVPPMSVPMIKDLPPPRVEPRPAPVPVPVVAPVVQGAPVEPVEPGTPAAVAAAELTGRAKRVADAMATRDAQAAKLAAHQSTDGDSAAKQKGRSRIGKVVKLLVAAAVVGVLALNGPHLVSTASTWGPDLWAQLNGKSGSASACPPVVVPTTAAPAPKPTTKKGAAKRPTTKDGRKAEARKQRQRQRAAAAAARTQALESPVC